MSELIEIEAGHRVDAVTFSANGKYIVSGGREGVQVWQVKDGKQVATMKTKDVLCVAVSKDGRFIAAGSDSRKLGSGDADPGKVLVWDAATYKQIFAEESAGWTIRGVDFSPDSSRLVSADGGKNTATIRDVAGKGVQVLDHGQWVGAAKYSPQGDQIATVSEKSVRVWDSDNGRLLVEVAQVELRPFYGLLWLNDHLFVTTKDSKIREIDASTGSTISEWSVPHSSSSCIALPQHGQFIAYSTSDSITLWGTSTTHPQLRIIPRSGKSRLIAFSSHDGRDLHAIVAQEQKIVIQDLSFVDLFSVKGLEIHIDSVALIAWQQDRLQDAEKLISESMVTTHHVHASRALVRARSENWAAALADAERSIKTQPSVIGYIAKCVALVGKGDTRAAFRLWDTASQLLPNHVSFLLLIKAVVLFTAGWYDDAISRIDDLILATNFDSMLYVVQAYMHFLLGDLRMDSGNYERAIQSFQHAQDKLRNRKERPPLIITLISGWNFDDLVIRIQKGLCEAFFRAGRIKEAAKSMLRIVDPKTSMSESIKSWIPEFIQQFLSSPGDDNNSGQDVSHLKMPLLGEWTKLRLTSDTWESVLASATDFTFPRFTIYQVICEHLERNDHVVDAVLCFRQMCSELVQEIDGKGGNWIQDFESKCLGKLEHHGNNAMLDEKYDEAILQYTTALSLKYVVPQDLLVKRSKAYASKGEWEDALNDANEVIALDPSSPFGYQRRFAASYGIGRHDDATDAFKTMLLKMSESSDPKISEQAGHYFMPDVTKGKIRAVIQDTIRDLPLVMINTVSGRLCGKSEQASSFEKTPTFVELISSTTTYIDTHMSQKVEEYFRYATFSHKWEDDEPLFEKVVKIVVYDLEASPAHEKLQMFCKIVREAGFNWAWSDTCCINKGDHFVLQEALVSMFKWYERSAMTIIFLRGVDRLAKCGALTKNIWNKRAWTLQEYHASKVVRIYTEDWTPYLGLTIYNHKESPEIILEMENATGISAEALKALCPGWGSIREKLRLASTRQTTRVEDAAYSLLGIFSLSLPITYGEGDKALGRLLAQLLTSSGDVSVLAWTGKSGSFNSCLPSSIIVFGPLPTSHIPSAISEVEIGRIATETRSLDPTLLTKLYEQVDGLPVPSFAGHRMKLPCIAFKLGHISVSGKGSDRVFRAQTNGLGIVEIRTEEDLSQLGSLCLVHPWTDFLLDRQPVERATAPIIENMTHQSSVPVELPAYSEPPNITSPVRRIRVARLLELCFGGRSPVDAASLRPPSTLPIADAASLRSPSTLSPEDKQTRVQQFIARLRQPFGALLLTGTRQNMHEYRRVASDSLITVRMEEITPAVLDKLMRSVRTLDVL